MAVESADVVILRDDIGAIPGLIELSKRCRLRIRQNITLAVSIKIIFVGLALSEVLAKLWVAVLVDAISVLLVLANSRRGMGTLPGTRSGDAGSEDDESAPTVPAGSVHGAHSAVDDDDAHDHHTRGHDHGEADDHDHGHGGGDHSHSHGKSDHHGHSHGGGHAHGHGTHDEHSHGHIADHRVVVSPTAVHGAPTEDAPESSHSHHQHRVSTV